MGINSKKIIEFAQGNELWSRGDKIIVAVSGGPDSVFLCHFLVSISKKYRLKLHVAHVNYGLRGADSEKDEQLVKKLAEKLDIPYSIFRAPKNKKTDENTLRGIRYDFFADLRGKTEYNKIAIGHTMDDQAETVLFRLIRGTGLNGLSAIRAKNETIIRPLLETRKKDIIAYLRENKIKFRIDQSNLKNEYSRNKLRNLLIPFLARQFNPKIVETLAVTASVVGEDYRFIEKQAEEAKKNFQIKEGGNIEFSRQAFLNTPLAIQHQVLHSILGAENKTDHQIVYSQVRELLKVLKSTKSKPQTVVIRGLKLVRKGDRVLLLSK